MTEIRRRFHDELKMLESSLVDMAGHVDEMLRDAVRALVTRDHSGVPGVVEHDDIVDDIYLTVERRWHEVMAMQTPVAVDLRLMSTILHISTHLERMADVAVNIAKTARKTRKLPATDLILMHIGEMGDIARNMIRTAMEAFAARDLDRALRVPEMDDDVDRLNSRMYREVVKCHDDPELLEWAIRMMVTSRHLERVGDHAVHIAEHVAFLLTGEFREFDEAS